MQESNRSEKGVKISWMRNPSIVICSGIVSGLVDLCEYLKSRGAVSLMYEIGSFAGESSEVFARYFGQVHCVDPWSSDPAIICDSRMNFTAEDVETSWDERAYDAGNMTKHKGLSVDVAETVRDESLDFAYIDALHDYAHVVEDIAAWWPKVRREGFIGGHDYQSNPASDFEVYRAVNEFVESKPNSAVELRIFGDTSWLVRKI